MQIVPAINVERVQPHKVPSQSFPQIADIFKNHVMEMIDFTKKASGIGLSAIQVGFPFNMFVAYDFDKNVWKAYFNASYCPLGESKLYQATEGCLSYPGKEFIVNRFDKVYLEYEELNPENMLSKISKTFSGQTAQVLQHETDHCHGITIKMIGKEI